MKRITKMSDKKKKKNKVRYIDDGSTVYDMSGLDGSRKGGGGRKGTAKEQFGTYMKAVKQMIIPMLVTMAIICVVFGLLYLLLCLAE